MATKKQMIAKLEDSGIIIPENSTLEEIKKLYNETVNLFERETEKIEPEKVEPEKVETEKIEPEKVEPQKDGDNDGDEWKKLNDDLSKKNINLGDTNPPDFFDNEDKPLIEKTRKRKSKKESDPDSFRIEGFILLIAIDVVFPTLIKFINDRLLKKEGIPLDVLRLTDEQMKKIEPLANQAADYMKVHISPITGFLVASGFIYTNNYINSGYMYTPKKKIKK